MVSYRFQNKAPGVLQWMIWPTETFRILQATNLVDTKGKCSGSSVKNPDLSVEILFSLVCRKRCDSCLTKGRAGDFSLGCVETDGCQSLNCRNSEAVYCGQSSGRSARGFCRQAARLPLLDPADQLFFRQMKQQACRLLSKLFKVCLSSEAKQKGFS